MHVVIVNIQVKPEHIEAFIEATLDNARNTRKEPGNLRFDVLRDKADANHVMLYEVYKAPEDFTAHQQSAHYFRWRDAVADWFVAPRTSVKCAPAFFGDGEAV